METEEEMFVFKFVNCKFLTNRRAYNVIVVVIVCVNFGVLFCHYMAVRLAVVAK